MKINDLGFELIKSFESCKLKAYQDVVGIWTIGWGHVGDVARAGNEIDQATADALLCEDLGVTERGVQNALKVKVSDNQFSAMVCFAFNVGVGAFRASTLLKLVNKGHFTEAADEFPKWCKAQGKVIPGLLRRREAERKLFLDAVWQSALDLEP